ncbi:hypothetical protein F5Y16DRAFT_397833 [Xylariaceae sp. FL0255]|nr:hypothetical protein F5Y16DRAFT_397833 [Xylariaceae sp. FL0255]
MEPPLKRPRYDHSDDEENQDELSFHPVQFDKIQDPGYQLDKGRARAANRLKNTFEDIFAKYGKDFGDDEGDVVNFYTGKIEVDNGHVQSLETHKLGDEESESVGDEEEERISTGQPSKPSKALAPRNSFKQNGVSHRRPSWESHSGLNTYRLSSFAVVPPKVGADPPFNFGSSLFGNNKAVDPVWDLPDLPVQQFYYQNNSLSDLFTNHGPKRLTTAKSFGVRRPSVSSEANDDGSGEDDILVGTNQQRETTSPVPPAKAVKETGNKDTPISDATPPRQGQQRRLLPPAESKDVLAMKTNLGPQSNGPRATHAIGVGDKVNTEVATIKRIYKRAFGAARLV